MNTVRDSCFKISIYIFTTDLKGINRSLIKIAFSRDILQTYNYAYKKSDNICYYL